MMKFLINIRKKSFFTFLGLALITLMNSCGIWAPADARKIPPSADERVKKNLEEGRGITIGGMLGSKGGTSFEFASSNPMWRASLEILDFLPLANVDYSGGVISTDWYNEGAASDESIKITVRFLTTEVRADGLRVIVHKRKCNAQQKCTIKKVSSAIQNELQVAILKKAAIFDKELRSKNRKKRPKIK